MNGSLTELLDVGLHQQDNIASLQSDGTYVTMSRLVISVNWWQHNNIIYCVSSNEDTDLIDNDSNLVDEFKIQVKFPPVISVSDKHVTLDEGANFTFVCEYKSNPATLTKIQIYHNYKEKVIDVKDTGTNVVVTVTNVSVHYEGVWSCVLSNGVGHVGPDNGHMTHLTVIKRPVVTISISGRRIE